MSGDDENDQDPFSFAAATAAPTTRSAAARHATTLSPEAAEKYAESVAAAKESVKTKLPQLITSIGILEAQNAGDQMQVRKLLSVRNACISLQNFFRLDSEGKHIWTAPVQTYAASVKRGEDEGKIPLPPVYKALQDTLNLFTSMLKEFPIENGLRKRIEEFTQQLQLLSEGKLMELGNQRGSRGALPDSDPFKFPGGGR